MRLSLSEGGERCARSTWAEGRDRQSHFSGKNDITPLSTRYYVAIQGKYTTISVIPAVRDRVEGLKRDQETYSELLAKMARQYDLEQDSGGKTDRKDR